MSEPRHPQLAPYSRPLLEAEAAANPYHQFEEWYTDAAGATRIVEAAALATVSPDAKPSLRMVLVQGRDERGFAFFTNYESRKGAEIRENSAAALLFYWDGLGRQVRIEGTVAKVGEGESDAYFAGRPRGAQLSAWASSQSAPVADRRALEGQAEDVRRRFEGQEVARPPWWGGYRLLPECFEFWQNRDDRLHDRLCYLRTDDLGDGRGPWRIERLQP